MAVKATLRRPDTKTKSTGGNGAIDVPSSVTGNVDETAAEKLAAELEAGAPIPGSDEAAAAESGGALVAPTSRTANVAAVNRYAQDSGGALEGDFNDSDLKLPQFKIVNGSGELSQRFNQGSLLLNDELIFEPPSTKQGTVYPTLYIVPIKLTKYYRENLSPDQVSEGLMPRSVTTIQEAEDLTGPGTASWGPDKQKPLWSPAARCIFAIQEPEECVSESAEFSNLIDDKNYALAVHYSSGMSYRECGKKILNAAQLSLRDRNQGNRIVLHKRLWVWKVVKKAFGPNKFTVFVPELSLTKTETGPEMGETAARILGQRVADAGE